VSAILGIYDHVWKPPHLLYQCLQTFNKLNLSFVDLIGD
jgi:hypothetical protein